MISTTLSPLVEKLSTLLSAHPAAPVLVALDGRCGSGKTTTVSMLERFYMPDEGRVCLGGVDINELSLSDYRRHFAYVQQGADVFGGTLREALCYGIERVISDEEIFAAAEKTGFAEYLSACPEGLEAELAPGGGSMSGGQSQRLVLTRELLRGGDIILMDEPTSALDPISTSKVEELATELKEKYTIVMVTHNMQQAARISDSVAFFLLGELVEHAPTAQLFKNPTDPRTADYLTGRFG